MFTEYDSTSRSRNHLFGLNSSTSEKFNNLFNKYSHPPRRSYDLFRENTSINPSLLKTQSSRLLRSNNLLQSTLSLPTIPTIPSIPSIPSISTQKPFQQLYQSRINPLSDVSRSTFASSAKHSLPYRSGYGLNYS